MPELGSPILKLKKYNLTDFFKNWLKKYSGFTSYPLLLYVSVKQCDHWMWLYIERYYLLLHTSWADSIGLYPLYLMTGVFKRERKGNIWAQKDVEGSWPCENRSRDWSYASYATTIQGMPGAKRSWKRKKTFPHRFFRGSMTLLTFDSRLFISRTMKE